ncbi:flagellar assembly protein FliW [Acidaminobacterium chupaoyuni]
MVKCSSRDFGQIEIREEDILSFQTPLFGFEQYTKFALLHNKEIGESLAWLQSLEDPTLCFILFNPAPLAEHYRPRIPDHIKNSLGDEFSECWVLCTIPQDIRQMTVNLKSPIFINLRTRRMAQIMLEQDYPVRFSLLKGGAQACSL